MATKLVMGASGFLGSHVTRLLVERGETVRVFLRETSSTRGIDDLDVERVYGDLTDAEAVRTAMAEVDDVFYCVVDTRSWLRDPAPLFRTNVEALRGVLEVAVEAGLHSFVFTSSITTLARNPERLVTEDDPHNWLKQGGAYVRSRMEAEELVLTYARDRGLPAVAMCVSNTYGTGDHQPTPHGSLVKAASRGKLRWYIRGAASEVVGIRSAAQAMVLGAEKGRVGERYVVSERYLSMRELHDVAAAEGGQPPMKIGVPYAVMYAAGFVGDVLARVLRRDVPLNRSSVRLMKVYTPVDHSKAERELGWEPAPTPDEIREAVAFYNKKERARS
ncbi:MAG TPA: NAD-dependent epimerase/dehydratase family protein [Nocardioidaceae bacterium]|nr:NAD-dependent epimerase/dehydratase family protein [Nocardioidaceae bacterium]